MIDPEGKYQGQQYRARLNPGVTDATAYMSAIPQQERPAPIWEQRTGPNVPEGYMDSTNVPKPTAARPTGGLKVFVDSLLFVLGATVVCAVAVACIRLIQLIWDVL
jgi:formate hydrogenlyase subunit 4